MMIVSISHKDVPYVSPNRHSAVATVKPENIMDIACFFPLSARRVATPTRQKAPWECDPGETNEEVNRR
jgi:hypothetical protein